MTWLLSCHLEEKSPHRNHHSQNWLNGFTLTNHICFLSTPFCSLKENKHLITFKSLHSKKYFSLIHLLEKVNKRGEMHKEKDRQSSICWFSSQMKLGHADSGTRFSHIAGQNRISGLQPSYVASHSSALTRS